MSRLSDKEYTVLNDRVLWYDGDSTVDPDSIADMVLRGVRIDRGVYVAEESEEILEFNKISTHSLRKKEYIRDFDLSWNIPKEYNALGLRKYLLQRLEEEIEDNDSLTSDDIEERINRLDYELDLYQKYNLESLLRTAIYVVDKFEETNTVWGVGRGSSCSSYILYLVGIHDIDSVYYELDAEEFLR